MFNIKITGLDNLQTKIREMAEKRVESVIQSKIDTFRSKELFMDTRLAVVSKDLTHKRDNKMIINHTIHTLEDDEILNPEQIIFFIRGIQNFYIADPFMQKRWHEDGKFEAKARDGKIEAWVLKAESGKTAVFFAVADDNNYDVMIYKPGKWVTHLKEVYKSFQQKYSERINDSDVF